MNFAAYDPVTGTATTPLDGTGTITVTCTRERRPRWVSAPAATPRAIVAMLLAPHPASASNFTVTPTEVNLPTSATSALVTLRNASKLPLRFEVTLVSCSEDERGKMMLNTSSG